MTPDTPKRSEKTSRLRTRIVQVVLFVVVVLIVSIFATEVMSLGYYFGSISRLEHPRLEKDTFLAALEVLFLIAGLWLLVSGKIPTHLLSLLFGKGNYQLPPHRARLLGLLLVSPLPVVFVLSFVLASYSLKDSLVVSLIFEIIYDFVVFIIVMVIAQKSRLHHSQAA